jgi:hypothetical protein
LANHKGNEDEIKKLEKLHKKGTDELHVFLLWSLSNLRLWKRRTVMLRRNWLNLTVRMSNCKRRRNTSCKNKRNCKRLHNRYMSVIAHANSRANILMPKLLLGSLTTPMKLRNILPNSLSSKLLSVSRRRNWIPFAMA